MPQTPERKRETMRQLRADPAYREARNAARRTFDPDLKGLSKWRPPPPKPKPGASPQQAAHRLAIARFTHKAALEAKLAEGRGLPTTSWWLNVPRADWGKAASEQASRIQASKFGQVAQKPPE